MLAYLSECLQVYFCSEVTFYRDLGHFCLVNSVCIFNCSWNHLILMEKEIASWQDFIYLALTSKNSSRLRVKSLISCLLPMPVPLGLETNYPILMIDTSWPEDHLVMELVKTGSN